MNHYSWTPAYIAAIEEHDRIELQKRIGEARKVMSERFSALVSDSLANGESEEFRQICDARRALDLLHLVSNDGELFPAKAKAQRKSA